MPRFAVILPAAGKSSRFRDREKKPFANLDGRAVWLRSAELFVSRDDVCQTVIIVAPDDQEMFRRRYGANLAFMNVQICEGGKERHDSIAGALALVKEEAEFIAIHDSVRPCLTNELVDAALHAAQGAPPPSWWRSVDGVAALAWDRTTLRVNVRDLLESSPRVLVWLRDRGYRCSHLNSQRADLETVFLSLTGRRVRNA